MVAASFKNLASKTAPQPKSCHAYWLANFSLQSKLLVHTSETLHLSSTIGHFVDAPQNTVVQKIHRDIDKLYQSLQ